MRRTSKAIAWIAGFTAYLAMAVPWFLWSSSMMWWGLPVWVWYHICWLIGATLLFWAFAHWFWAPQDGR